MCGICGFIDFNKKSDKLVLDKMVETLHHRGPNDRGSELYQFDNASIGFGQTRLSILDLSPLGHQPMHHEDLSIVFNGEIYNFEEIKKELILLGHIFKSDSDTEVILHSFKEWGAHCVSKFIGMFAFVILNKSTNQITIIRDRAGVKPLFYYWNNGLFLFASELKAFHQHPNFEKKINESSVHEYMDTGYISAPNSIFENCFKLEPGHILNLDLNKQKFKIESYWDVADYYKLPKLSISYEEAKEKVEELLVSSFNYRMVADVPVGVFLSGGYDSTAVAAILQKGRRDKLNTFTIGFEEGNNEAPFAKEISEYIGTNHTEYICTTKEAQDIIPTLAYYYDEPFGDSSAIPTILVSKLAKKNVTVALSADGGDEIFAGYDYYNIFNKNLNFLNKIPSISRIPISKLLQLSSNLIPSANQGVKKKVKVLSKLLSENKEDESSILHSSYFSLGSDIKSKLFKTTSEIKFSGFLSNTVGIRDNLSFALARDYKMYLQNDILAKVDRATMSVGLEGREPFLDHRIVEFSAQLPNDFKYSKNIQKRILKDIVHKYIPKSLMDRPKTGFTLPINEWLKTDLIFLIEEFLSFESIENSNIFDPIYVEILKEKFFKNTLYDPSIIWKLIQFQMWYKKWMLD